VRNAFHVSGAQGALRGKKVISHDCVIKCFVICKQGMILWATRLV